MTFDPNKLPENDKEWAEFYKDSSDRFQQQLRDEKIKNEGYRSGVQMVVSLVISHMKRG